MRLDVQKTFKLFIGGAFPRSESGRSTPVTGADGRVLAHASKASRKDLRAAVESAYAARDKWASAAAMLRGQVIYRLAEMLEGKRDEFIRALAAVVPGGDAASELDASIDRLVCFAGWADKYAQVLGCNNPVAGPYYNFTVPEPVGPVAVVAPNAPALLGIVGLLAPVLCAGNTVIIISGEANPLPAVLLGEACATADIPPGAVNILTGPRAELLPWIAEHREIRGIHAAGCSPEERTLLESGAAENLKRVRVRDVADWNDPACSGPWWIEPFIDFKTMWHPAAS